ncbi:MAG: hypothetical protein MUO76_10240, partial [Anaerolineaceae bacterium]|nr:hypothetical protein [Anaerolineaceae bacterium]
VHERTQFSQGSHFFHNLVNLGIYYFSVPFSSPFNVDWDWLNEQKVVEETEFLRHVELSSPLYIKVDGRSGRGVIYKSQGAAHGE